MDVLGEQASVTCWWNLHFGCATMNDVNPYRVGGGTKDFVSDSALEF